MTTHPVYDVCRPDFTRDCEPVGHASSEAEALAILARHFEGTGAAAPTKVELNDQERHGVNVWAYWPLADDAA
jgi:hypothetical protein